MDNYTELKTEQGKLLKEFNTLDEGAKAAKRSFSPEEKTRMGEIETRLVELNDQIETEVRAKKLREEVARNAKPVNLGVQDDLEVAQKSLRGYSIHEVIKARINGTPVQGIEREWAQEVSLRAKGSGTGDNGYGVPVEALMSAKQRAYSATGTTTETLDQGGQLIETEKPGLIDALGDYMILDKMGVTRMSNLKGNLSLPKELTKPAASFATETGAAADQAGLFDTVDLSPKRLAGYVDYTMQMMTQPTIAIEPYANKRLKEAIAFAVQKNFFVGTGTSNAPTGVITAILATGLQTLGGQVLESGGTMDWDSLVDLETAVDIQNGLMGSLAYAMNSKLRGTLKTTAKGASTNDHYLWDSRDPANPLNGYAAYVTNQILSTSTGTALTGGTATPLIFGNWSDSILANWGDVFIDLDKQYVGTGTYRLVINTFWDVAVTRTKSFSVLNDITTSFYGGS